MSRLTDLYKRVMYGQAGMDMPGQGMSEGTSGLFGQGGQQSGGLIDFNKMNNQAGGLLQNIPQTALLGSALFGQGMQGIDPFSALLPAVTQTAQLQQYMTPKVGTTKEVYDVKLQKNVFATEKQIQSTPDRFTPKLEDQSKISRDQTKNLQGLFTNNAIVKDFNMASTQFGKLTASAKQESAAGDMSMIFTYMKILDPTSVVREGEQATAKSAGGVPDRVWNAYNKAVSGEKLTETQRADFVGTASKLYNANIKQYDAFKDSFGSSIEQYGLDSSQVFLSGDLRPKQVKTKDGEIIDTSKAQLLDFDMATGEMIYVLPGGMKFRIKK
jgi:hypothetical protein